MADGGWTDPKVPLSIYAHAMRRDPDENERLRAQVNLPPELLGSQLSLGNARIGGAQQLGYDLAWTLAARAG